MTRGRKVLWHVQWIDLPDGTTKVRRLYHTVGPVDACPAPASPPNVVRPEPAPRPTVNRGVQGRLL